MIITAKLLNADKTGYTGAIVVRTPAGASVLFRPQAGLREWSADALQVTDGDVQIETLNASDVVVAAEDGSTSLAVLNGQPLGQPLGIASGSLSVAEEYTGSVDLAMIADEIRSISGQLVAGAGAGASCCTLTHIPAADRSVLVAVEGVLGLATLNTSGGVRLASAPSEGDVIEFLGSTII